MKVVLESIQSDDARRTAELARGEILEHRIALNIDGSLRDFTVFLRANVLADLDASLVYGDELLEELLRFEPRALNRLYSTVGKHTRGIEISLPAVVLDQTTGSTGLPANPSPG